MVTTRGKAAYKKARVLPAAALALIHAYSTRQPKKATQSSAPKVSKGAQLLAKKAMAALARSSLKKGQYMNTTGSYRGRFKQPVLYKPSLAQLYGAATAFEMGGISKSATCTYIGHAVSINELQLQVARAVVRRAFLQIRECPRSWTEKLRPNETVVKSCIEVVLNFMNAENSPIIVIRKIFNTAETLNDIAVWMNLQCYMGSGDEEKVLRSFAVYPERDNATVSLPYPLALLNLDDVHVHMSVVSRLSLQNRTRGADPTDNSRDSITNNPVEGKVYAGSNVGTRMRVFDNLAVATPDFYGHLDTGVIDVDPNSTYSPFHGRSICYH